MLISNIDGDKMKNFFKGVIEKFNSKPPKIRAAIIAVAIVVFAGFFAGGCVLFGNPITKIKIIDAANKYIDNNIGSMERSRSICKYDIKRDIYYIDFTPKGWKSSFRLEFNDEGVLTKDGYTIDYVYQGMYELR